MDFPKKSNSRDGLGYGPKMTFHHKHKILRASGIKGQQSNFLPPQRNFFHEGSEIPSKSELHENAMLLF